MNKFWKYAGITLAVVLVGFAGLVGLGYNMMVSGTEYLEAKGATNIQYLGNADGYVYCKGQGAGMAFLVNTPEDPTGDRIPVAVCITGLGTVTESR